MQWLMVHLMKYRAPAEPDTRRLMRARARAWLVIRAERARDEALGHETSDDVPDWVIA